MTRQGAIVIDLVSKRLQEEKKSGDRPTVDIDQDLLRPSKDKRRRPISRSGSPRGRTSGRQAAPYGKPTISGARMTETFDNKPLAKGFQISIDNYNELQVYEIESKMRKVVGQLLDPVVTQQQADRAEFIKFQLSIGKLKE